MTRFTMTANKSIPLAVPEGYYVFLQATTMAGFKIGFTVRDAEGGTAYFDESRQSLNPLPPLAAFFQSHASALELFVDIPQSQQIDIRMDSMDIADEKGNLILRTISIAGEDWTDKDYNDLLVTVTACKSNH
ncbi:hypothetical protein [Oscillibacter sp.]|uniref:hypothetical protein n=1 Tax=Oscillibacter sp. TaxID=1945593 RepID=UPI00289F1783|nr:hypothetical protein [Oscillibacter sp.]